MSKVYPSHNSNSHRSSMAQGSNNSSSNTPRVGPQSGTPTAPVQQQPPNVPNSNNHGHQQQQHHPPHRQYSTNPHQHHHHHQQQQHNQHNHQQQHQQQQQQQQPQPHIQHQHHHHQQQQHSQHHQQQQHQQQQHSHHHQQPPHHQQHQPPPPHQQHQPPPPHQQHQPPPPHQQPQQQQQQPQQQPPAPPPPQTQPQPLPQPQNLPQPQSLPPPSTQQQQLQIQQQQLHLQQQHQQQHYPNGQQMQLGHIQVSQYQNHLLVNQHQPVQQQQPLPHQQQQQFLPQPHISQHPQMGVTHPPQMGPIVLQTQQPPAPPQQQHPPIPTQPPHFQGGGETHMTNRLPLNQQAYMIASPYLHHQNYPQFLVSNPMTNLNMYPGGHMPQPSPAMMPQPIRVPNDLGIRQQYEPQNQTTPLPVPTAMSQLPVVKPPLPPATIPSQVSIATTPITPIPQTKPIRERKALAIVDPRTKHVFTVDELKGSPTTPQSQPATKDPSTPGISPKDTSISDKESSTDDMISKSTGESISSEKPPEELVLVQETNPQKDKPASIEEKVSIPAEVETKVLENGDTKVQVETVSELTESIGKLAVTDNTVVEAVAAPAPIADKQSDETENSQDLKEPRDSKDPPEAKEPVKKNPLPNLPYAAGQFSPLNPNGRRKYSIEFLKAVAAEMKLDLGTTSSQNHRGYDSFVPHYVNQNNIGSNFRDFTPSQTLSRRSSQQAINKPRRVITTHSLQQEVELKTAEKPWKPELENEKSKIVESGEMDTKRLLKVFRGHLNKLTPQKYDSLIEKIGALDLDGPERLNSVIDLVFDKAVDEPGFCELYARMCKVIAAKDSDFCFHLVKKCQEEFETSDLYTGLNVEERKIEIEQESDVAKRKLMSEELYEEMRLRRKKYLGTIKLIGEMYKLGLLLPKIIGLCMTHLIEEASNENIECLCSLIATVGAKMANEPEDTIKSSLKNTLTVLQDIAYSKRTNELFTLESRIKFKILDTIDLSKRSWRPRMVENNPKKIEEIHEEAKEELLRQQHHSNQSKNMLRSDDRDRSRRGGLYNSYSAKGGQANKPGW